MSIEHSISGRFRGISQSVLGVGPEGVVRKTHSWTPAVHELLGHLAAVDFTAAPRVLGVDPARSRETLSYIPGDEDSRIGDDYGENFHYSLAQVVPEKGLSDFAVLLRSYHDAVSGFEPSHTRWMTVTKAPESGDVVCHGDFGPWNVIWKDGLPVGIVDWDLAGPRPPAYDIAYALDYTVPLRADDDRGWWSDSEPPDQVRRLKVFLDAYGMGLTRELVDQILIVQPERNRWISDFAARGIPPWPERVAAGDLECHARRQSWIVRELPGLVAEFHRRYGPQT